MLNLIIKAACDYIKFNLRGYEGAIFAGRLALRVQEQIQPEEGN